MPRVVWNEPGWPCVFELNVGGSHQVSLPLTDGNQIVRTVKLLGVEHSWESDFWVPDNADRRTLRLAKVKLDVDGRQIDLPVRPFQMPTEAAGLRMYVETTKLWATHGKYAALEDVQGDVRLSVRPAGAPWGPELLFPIRDYRWRSSTYNNTWSALVPYNKLYYHRGEDFGAIPDRLVVQAVADGQVVTTPLPAGDGKSNALGVKLPCGLIVRQAHMNIESIDPGLTVGAAVKAAQALAKTGCTWAGKRSQVNDPHLHVGFHLGRRELSPYPFLVEAYLRTYDDPILPVAGGYAFTVPGESVELDGSRSIARPGRKIAAYRWTLHDGNCIEGPRTTVAFDKPGLYCEALAVRADDGSEDRDFAQVRVYDPNGRQPGAFGWVHCAPVRGIKPGAEVLFWNRLKGLAGKAGIDFGDGSSASLGDEARHAYTSPGLYTVSVTGRGPAGEPITVKLRVVVDKGVAATRPR